jgi:hypothetical protein
VLKFKRDAEVLLKQSSLPWTVVRPSRLTDGPYTSFDVSAFLGGAHVHVCLDTVHVCLFTNPHNFPVDGDGKALYVSFYTHALHQPDLSLCSVFSSNPVIFHVSIIAVSWM